MDLNTLADLQAELQAAEHERTRLLQLVARTPLVDSDEESYSDDEDDSSQPGGSSIILPPPLPPSAAAPRKVLSWGVSGASGHRSQERRQPAAHTPQPLAQRSTQSNAGSGINTDKEIGSCVRRGGSEESSESGPGSGSPARARALASDCDTAPRSASTDAEHSNNVAKAGIIQHRGLVGAECDVVSQSASADKHSNNVAMARSTKHDGCVGAKGGDNGKLYASGAANGGGATAGWVDEEGVRRSVLREVLAVMLGPQAAHKVDCYQLDVQTVAAVAQQRPSNSPSSNNHMGAVAAQRLAKEQAEKAAALEARSRAERELAACKSMLDEERTQAKRKLDASKREAEGLVKEKRDLMARLGQQGRDARAAASALQEMQERVASLEQKVCVQHRAAAVAQRSSEQARSEHKAGKEALEVALVAAKQEAQAVKEESKKQGERAAQEVAQQAARALTDAGAEVEVLRDLLQSMQAEVEQQQKAVFEQLAELRQAVAQLRPELGSELAELSSVVGSSVTGLEARFQRLASECNKRTSALLQLDTQIAALGPEGVDKLHREVREAQQHQAHAEQESRQQAIKLAGCEAHRSKLAMEKQVQAAELAMHMQQQAELKCALATTDSALSKCKADVAQLTGRASHLAQQLQQVHERAGKLETAADAAKERAVHAQQQAREAKAQQETYQQECDALREQAELAQKQAAAVFACGVQQASASAAALVKALRDKYFQASLIASPSSWHLHHDHHQQQQQQQVGSATTEACAEQNISKGAVVSPGGDGHRAQGVLALHSNMGRVAGGIGSAQHGDSLGQGPPLLQASHSLVASAAYEDAFGLKLCRLSHEGLMGAFQEYSKRQGQLDIAALIQQHHDHQHSHGQPHHDHQHHDQPRHDHQHHSRQHSRGQPHHAFLAASTTSISAAKAMSQQEPLPEGAWAECGAANSSRCAAACGAADSSTMAEWGADVCLELLWLEGCLLLALVEGRQAQQQQQQQKQHGLRLKERGAAQAGWKEDAGQEGVEGEKRALRASAEGGTHKQGVLEGNAAKELVGQMMRAMARDRKLLQQRVHQLEAQASPHSSRIPTTHAHSLTTSPTSLPARRVLSAQPSAPLMPSSVLQHQPRMHSASAATGRKSIAAALATAAGAPLAAAVAAAPGCQQLLQQQQQQQVALDGHAHMQAAHHGLLVAPSSGSAGGQGLTALGQMGVRSSGQGSTEPASPSSSATPAPAPAPAAASSHLGASGNRGLTIGRTEDSSASGPAAAWQPQAHRGADQLNKADYDDDVWNVLEALEESSLRSSRGLHGLRSASGRGGMHGGSHCVGRGGLEGVMAGKRALESRGSGRGPRGTGFLTPGPGQALGFQPRAQLSPGQAFVAKYREAGRGERGRT